MGVSTKYVPDYEQPSDVCAVSIAPSGVRSVVRRVAKVRGVDAANLCFHGGALTKAAADRQHRRIAFDEAMAFQQAGQDAFDDTH